MGSLSAGPLRGQGPQSPSWSPSAAPAGGGHHLPAVPTRSARVASEGALPLRSQWGQGGAAARPSGLSICSPASGPGLHRRACLGLGGARAQSGSSRVPGQSVLAQDAGGRGGDPCLPAPVPSPLTRRSPSRVRSVGAVLCPCVPDLPGAACVLRPPLPRVSA